MIKYVCGFAFNQFRTKVVLILKLKGPSVNINRWNGVGGKLEVTDPTPSHAMMREFSEETGVTIPEEKWNLFCTMGGNDWEVDFFRAFTEDVYGCATIEEEMIAIIDVDRVLGRNGAQRLVAPTADNLEWLIPMALTQGVTCLATSTQSNK